MQILMIRKRSQVSVRESKYELEFDKTGIKFRTQDCLP